MSGHTHKRHKTLLAPLLIVGGSVALCAYSVVAVLSADPVWFLGRATVPDPERIVVRVAGQETVLTAGSLGYDQIVAATRQSLSSFQSLSFLSAGLSEAALEEYQHRATVVELYFDRPVDFHLPVNDRRPTALLIPIEGHLAGRGYVFLGRGGAWWAGPMQMTDPQPLLDALSALGFIG